MRSAPRLVIAGLASVMLGVCATPYQPYSKWSDGGFTDREVLPGVFLVQFTENEATAPERTADFATLRAVEICLQRGKPFMRVGGLATGRVQSGYLEGLATATTVPTGEPNSPPIVSVSSTPPTLLYAPRSELVVACGDEQQTGFQDASQMARLIRARYSLG